MNASKEQEIDPKVLKQKDNQALMLSMIMLAGGAALFKYTTEPGSEASLYQLLVASFLLQGLLVGAVFLVTFIQHKMDTNSDKNLNIKLTTANSVSIGFMIWLVVVVLFLLAKFI